MASVRDPRRPLRMRLCEIERGLFRADCGDTRRSAATDGLVLPLYETGRNSDEVRQIFEATVLSLGYPAVIWEPPAPLP